MRIDRRVCGCLLAMSACVLVAGCGLIQKNEVRRGQLMEPEKYVERRLQDASESISHDLAALTGSRQRLDYTIPPSSLSSVMDYVYDGPIEGALSGLCAQIGYQFVVEGKAPENRLIVHVKMKGRRAVEILRDIGIQTGKNEGVIVDESIRMVRLVYGNSEAQAKPTVAVVETTGGM